MNTLRVPWHSVQMSDVTRLRRASGKDALAAAEVWLRSRRASVPSIPPPVHSDVEVRAWFEAVVIPERETWIAEIEKSIVAVMALKGPCVDHLYVDPLWTARGIGNQAISEKLFLTGKTVEAHVRSIFMKLGLEPAADDHRRVLAVLTYLRSV